MEVNFIKSFEILKNCLSYGVDGLGEIISHWEEPHVLNANRTVMLPESCGVYEGKLGFSVELFISVAEKSTDTIAASSMKIMQDIFKVVYGGLPSDIISASVTQTKFFMPLPQNPDIEVLYVVINMTINYPDDCG